MSEIDRRDFLKLVGVSAGAATAAGCSDPVEKLIPYVIQPEEIVPGIPVVYASTCRECPAGCGLHVKTREGRPIKLEGNPDHPVNRGALCSRGQAAIGWTYHPDRYQGPMRRGSDGSLESISWDEAIELLAGKVKEAGRGTFVLGGDPGPTASALLDRWTTAVGAGGRIVYETFAHEALREASRTVFGVEGVPVFDLSASDFVIDFGSDVLETGLSPTEHSRQLADARDVSDPEKRAARFVYVGPRLSGTAGSADDWLAPRPGSEGILALGLARVAAEHGAGTPEDRARLAGLLGGFDVASTAQQTGVDAAAIERVGHALAQAHAAVALPPGVALTSRRGRASAAAVLILNQLVGAVGSRLRIHGPGSGSRPAKLEDIQRQLVQAMESGQVKVLLIHDANPVYSLPSASGFETALEKVDFVVSFASSADETSARADLILPDHTPLESWGDAQPRPGVRSLLQPTVRPLYDTRALGDTLLDVGRAVGADVAARLPSGSFRGVLEEAWSGTDMRQALALGGVFSERAPQPVSLAATATKVEVAKPVLEGDGDLVLLAFPSTHFYDGRGANLPWLQEVADPVAKVAWGVWAELSLATASKLGVGLGDVISLETAAGRIEAPAFPRGGIRDDVVAVPIGQGHTVGHFASHAGDGRPGEARGANVIGLLPAATDEAGGRAWLTTRARATATGTHRRLAMWQHTDNKRGRQLGESVALASLGGASAGHHAPAEPAHGEGGHGDEGHGSGSHEIHRPYDPAADAVEESPYRWGMNVDLDRCNGCSACITACYVENNIPFVGEEQSTWGRHMPWLRIERYVGDGEPNLESGWTTPTSRETLGDTDVRHSPMPCQHCGAAPCEPVCPVIATYHNQEGLNGMIYNRCIGTRYCSNNCPYKVRRYNYYEYGTDHIPEPMQLMLNPDVTVRCQGVMEKCSFCIQRVEAARQTAKDEGRPIADGEVQSACQQACPSRAITFGNLRDEKSAVVEKNADEARAYHALHVLNTRPAVTYLAKVKRGKVEGQDS